MIEEAGNNVHVQLAWRLDWIEAQENKGLRENPNKANNRNHNVFLHMPFFMVFEGERMYTYFFGDIFTAE